MHPEEISLKWLGASGFEIRFKDRLILVDPLLSRPYDSTPSVSLTPYDYKKFDILIATHGHFDHFQDVPYLAVTVDAPVYIPRAGKKDIREQWRKVHYSARLGNPDKWYALEDTHRIQLDELTITPIRTEAESFDPSTVVDAVGRIFGRKPLWDSIKRGLKAMTSYPFGNSHMLHLDWKEKGARIMFAGGLTKHAYGLTADNSATDILALPVAPINKDWMKETERLIRRLQPSVVIAHHFDNFYPPITADVNIHKWKNEVQAMFPKLRIYIPKINERFTLEDVQGASK